MAQLELMCDMRDSMENLMYSMQSIQNVAQGQSSMASAIDRVGTQVSGLVSASNKMTSSIDNYLHPPATAKAVVIDKRKKWAIWSKIKSLSKRKIKISWQD